LESQLKDTPITALHSHYHSTVIIDSEVKIPAFPAKVTAYLRRGKYIILHLEKGNALVIHLRMTGKLIYTLGDYPEAKHVRASFELANGDILLFNDIRTFGKIILCPQNRIDQYLPKLGPEPLSAEFDAKSLQQALKKKKAPIKTTLLDQSIVAGLGNIYVCEILYRTKLHPETPANQVNLPKLKLIVKHTREILIQAIANNGTSISDFRQIDDKTGEFQNFLQVYQKDTCPQGHQVQRIKQAGRSTFYCAICQA
jgi:formamidopyrimidine-DNA glycosylase